MERGSVLERGDNDSECSGAVVDGLCGLMEDGAEEVDCGRLDESEGCTGVVGDLDRAGKVGRYRRLGRDPAEVRIAIRCSCYDYILLRDG